MRAILVVLMGAMMLAGVFAPASGVVADGPVVREAIGKYALKTRENNINQVTFGSLVGYEVKPNGAVKSVSIRIKPITKNPLDEGEEPPPRGAKVKIKRNEEYGVLTTSFPVSVTPDRLEIVNSDTSSGIRWLLPTAPSVQTDAVIESDRSKFTYIDRGVLWAWVVTKAGIKLEGTVVLPFGLRTYQFPYELIGGATSLVLTGEGAIRSNTFQIPPVVVIDAKGIEYPGGAYVLVPGAVEFNFDDSVIPLGNYPYVIDPTTNFDIDVGLNDGYTEKIATVYPPDGTGGSLFSDTGVAISAVKQLVASDYTTRTVLMGWDTSSLPNDAIITGATLTLQVGLIFNPNNPNLVIAWYDVQPPFSLADHVDDEELGTAPIALEISLGAITPSASGDFILNIDENTISKSEVTSIRLSLSGGAPNASNSISFEAFEASGTDEPRLTVTYVDPIELTVPTLGDIKAYESTVEIGDITVIAQYNIDTSALASLPSELASESYVGIFGESTTIHQTVSPVSTAENLLKGYEDGFLAFYFTAAQVTQQGLIFGSPGLYDVSLQATDPTLTTTIVASSTDIAFRSRSELLADMQLLAQKLESDWGVDLLTNSVLNAPGQDYFEAVWPFINNALPVFMNIGKRNQDLTVFTLGTSGSDANSDFWVGTDVADGTNSLGTLWGMTGFQARSLISLLLIGLGVVIALKLNVPPAGVMMMSLVAIVFFGLIGFIPQSVWLLMGFICLALSLWILIGRRALTTQ